MEPLQMAQMTLPGRRRTGSRAVVALGIATLVLGVGSGCIPTLPVVPWPDFALAPPVSQVVATWNPAVVFTPDPANNGVRTPGLVGRVYLFGPDLGYPLVGDGSLTVALFDDSRTGPDGTPLQLEEWRIDKDTLHRLLKRDTIGMGYTLFLPWGTYKPEIVNVHFKVRYEPCKGAPIYLEDGPLTLTAPRMEGTVRQIVPNAPRG